MSQPPGEIARELASTWPEEPSAATATSGSLLLTAIDVSKPCRGTVASTLSGPVERPARTSHALTAVAPFQLACTVTRPSAPACAAIAGTVFGCPLQGAR